MIARCGGCRCSTDASGCFSSAFGGAHAGGLEEKWLRSALSDPGVPSHDLFRQTCKKCSSLEMGHFDSQNDITRNSTFLKTKHIVVACFFPFPELFCKMQRFLDLYQWSLSPPQPAFPQAMVIPLLLKCAEAADDEDSAYCCFVAIASCRCHGLPAHCQ